jgi:hypothetical protein
VYWPVQYWMDSPPYLSKTSAMARYHHNVYASAKTPRYVVLFDLQWQMIESQRLEPSADLRSAINTVIDRLACDGWKPESAARFGFVFLSRNGARRLLILTERNPFDTGPQTFSPFK